MAQTFGQRQDGVFGGRIHGTAGTDFVSGHRRHIDEVPEFLPLHVGKRRRNAVQHALDVDVDHAVPVSDFQPFQRRVRHQPGIVDHHVDPAISGNGGID